MDKPRGEATWRSHVEKPHGEAESQVPLKPSTSVEFMINLSIQKYSFSCPALVPPQDCGVSKGELLLSRTLRDLPGTDPPMSCTCLLFVEKL